MNPHVKILILNWNSRELLKNCLESVSKIDYMNYSVLVVDNGSIDGSLEMLKSDYMDIKLFELKENFGFAGGYNRCFQSLKNDESDFWLLLNNDTEVHPGILSAFADAIDKKGSGHIYGSKIFYQDDPQRIWYAGGRVNIRKARVSHNGLRKLDSDEFSNFTRTDYITGCCLMAAPAVFRTLNGFDEQFNMYGEDVDLCLRARNAGMNCYFVPEAQLWHHVSASIGGNWSLRKLIRKFSSLIKLYRKHKLN